MHLITLGILIDSTQTGLLSLGWIVVGYIARTRALLEDGGLLGMGQSVAGYMARIKVLLEDGIGARSLVRNLAIGIVTLSFGSFVEQLSLVAGILIVFHEV